MKQMNSTTTSQSKVVKISAVILTLNEEKNIERCLSSLCSLVDEIVVVDSFSTDKTRDLCHQYNARFLQHPFEGFIEQKNWGMAQAAFDHILSVEGDEALSDTLQKSIAAVKQNWIHDVYVFNRLTYYCGQWIRHGGWYPDKKLRLFDRRKGRFGGTNPHDKFILAPGATKVHLKGDLLHYAFTSISEHLILSNKYSDIKAKGAYEKGKTGGWLNLVFNPLFRFLRTYFFKLGFLDGFNGLVISVISAQSNFLKYAKIMQMNRDKHKNTTTDEHSR